MSSIPLHGRHWTLPAPFHRHTAVDAGRHSNLFVPTLDDGERVLYRSKDGSATTIVATDHAVHFRTGDSAWRRIAWCDVVATGHSAPESATTLQLWPDAGGGIPVVLATDGRFAEFAAERIAYVRVFSRRIRLTPRVAGVVEAVRVATGEPLAWRVHLDVPVYADNPLVAGECARVVAELRALAGC